MQMQTAPFKYLLVACTFLSYHFSSPVSINVIILVFFHTSRLHQDELTENQELIQTYRLHIAQDINQDNLALFCGSYQ